MVTAGPVTLPRQVERQRPPVHPRLAAEHGEHRTVPGLLDVRRYRACTGRYRLPLTRIQLSDSCYISINDYVVITSMCTGTTGTRIPRLPSGLGILLLLVLARIVSIVEVLSI